MSSLNKGSHFFAEPVEVPVFFDGNEFFGATGHAAAHIGHSIFGRFAPEAADLGEMMYHLGAAMGWSADWVSQPPQMIK
jgi:hypothetical protein